jgi:ATP-dependent DNA helicase RecG
MSHHENYLQDLLRELIALPRETEWVEFKHNNGHPQEVGEYLSALANSAALTGKAKAYIVWGINDENHAVLGTDFEPQASKVGNEEIENWLLRQLAPKIEFRFDTVVLEEKRLVLLSIDRAFRHPVQFAGVEFIRIGSYKKKLKDYPEKERALWRIFDAKPFEALLAAEKIGADEVLKLLDYPAYFDLMQRPLPEQREGILQALAADRLIEQAEGGRWNIRNLGAVLFAKRLSDFSSTKRKAMRVIVYKGTGRVQTLREQAEESGYATGFKRLISFINSILPSNEVIGQALRRTVPVYPELAIRELVANALVHQDFFAMGSGPMVEVFDDRMEISNPGLPLVEPPRFLDHPPRSRNEELAGMMRLAGICEERGSGIDKVVFECEFYQLPAPTFETIGDSTRSTLWTPRSLTKMDQADRVRAVYLHACLRYVQRDFMTNTSLRARFGIEAKNSALATRLIAEAVTAKEVRPHDPAASRKYMKYVPKWA